MVQLEPPTALKPGRRSLRRFRLSGLRNSGRAWRTAALAPRRRSNKATSSVGSSTKAEQPRQPADQRGGARANVALEPSMIRGARSSAPRARRAIGRPLAGRVRAGRLGAARRRAGALLGRPTTSSSMSIARTERSRAHAAGADPPSKSESGSQPMFLRRTRSMRSCRACQTLGADRASSCAEARPGRGAAPGAGRCAGASAGAALRASCGRRRGAGRASRRTLLGVSGAHQRFRALALGMCGALAPGSCRPAASSTGAWGASLGGCGKLTRLVWYHKAASASFGVSSNSYKTSVAQNRKRRDARTSPISVPVRHDHHGRLFSLSARILPPCG